METKEQLLKELVKKAENLEVIDLACLLGHSERILIEKKKSKEKYPKSA